LSRDVDGERDERKADDPERRSLPVTRHVLQMPDHDERGRDLDQRVEPETSESNRAGDGSGDKDDDAPDNIPTQRHVFEAKTPTQEQLVHEWERVVLNNRSQ
jgi:hypothetical protein